MACTPSAAPPATAPAVAPASLAAAFAAVPDPRRQASVDDPLPAILTLAVAAILSAHDAVLAIAAWGARQRAELLAQPGFAAGRTPCQATRQRPFARLDGDAVSAALSAYFAPGAAPAPAVAGAQGVVLDGKAQRGRLQYAARSTPSPPAATSRGWPSRTSRSGAAPTRPRRR